jgi:hypothetical protein
MSDRYAFESMSDQPLYAVPMSPGSPIHAFEMEKSFRHLAGFGVTLIDTPSPENRVTLDKEATGRRRSRPDHVPFGAKQVLLPTTGDVPGYGVSLVILTTDKIFMFGEPPTCT